MSAKSKRERDLHFALDRASHGVLQPMSYENPSGASSLITTPRPTGHQVTMSERNAWHKLRKYLARYEPGTQWDIGSDFETWRHEYQSNIPGTIRAYSSDRNSAIWNRYTGPVYARPVNGDTGDFPFLLPPTNLLAKGSTAISRVLPTNPAADAATFAAEIIREGIPSIVGAQLLSKRNGPPPSRAGSEYLNWEFGWAPIISGVKDFAVVARDYEKILEQYRRDSGRNVRRRFEFPEETETTETKVGNSYPYPLSASYFSRAGTLTTTTKKTRRVWFSGCFTYYLDPGDTALGRANRAAQEARKLLNIELTPAVVWNLAPWSWAVDWFTNVGDVFHNMSAFQQDGLVMRYGYVMETTIHEVTYDLSGLAWRRNSGPSRMTETFRTIGKRRLHATPYGFGVDPLSLTKRQGAIIAALGLTRGRNAR